MKARGNVEKGVNKALSSLNASLLICNSLRSDPLGIKSKDLFSQKNEFTPAKIEITLCAESSSEQRNITP